MSQKFRKKYGIHDKIEYYSYVSLSSTVHYKNAKKIYFDYINFKAISSKKMPQTDLIIHDEKDNVAVVFIDKTSKNQECNGWIMENDKTIKVKSISEIPLGHKIALQDFKEGDTILKYGHDIGKVVAPIKKGNHVHVHNVKTKKW